MVVKKLGRIDDGGGWRANGPEHRQTAKQKRAEIGYDYVHSLIDDHSRYAYSEIVPNEQGPTCAAFFLRAAQAFAEVGITRIERLITDNHMSYKRSVDMRAAVTAPGARRLFIKPHCPGSTAR
ncbi:DDE-type integrase/transposase/recombinase [Nocardioides sp.]|uniref:DDE-type integrase/transposase/recombinase n=1 Tax=Nocardioides sp. TaxID=35761 RepID=UPI00343CD6EE|nr:transposase, family [Naasia sp.]MCW2737701.1 transposase, family [Nocardioides sp.]